MTPAPSDFIVRNTRAEDFAGIGEMTAAVYPGVPPWNSAQLASHLRVFPEGQFVALEPDSQRVVGMAASLIIPWDDYDIQSGWRDFTDNGMFTNHDPARGRTLYGAEVMVRPGMQGRGIGKQLYAARGALVQRLRLLRIRAGARLRDYHLHAAKWSAEEYVRRVVRGEVADRTLTFQLKRGFHVIGVASHYLLHDPHSLGYAAVIEWVNREVAAAGDFAQHDAWLNSGLASSAN